MYVDQPTYQQDIRNIAQKLRAEIGVGAYAVVVHGDRTKSGMWVLDQFLQAKGEDGQQLTLPQHVFGDNLNRAVEAEGYIDIRTGKVQIKDFISEDSNTPLVFVDDIAFSGQQMIGILEEAPPGIKIIVAVPYTTEGARILMQGYKNITFLSERNIPRMGATLSAADIKWMKQVTGQLVEMHIAWPEEVEILNGSNSIFATWYKIPDNNPSLLIRGLQALFAEGGLVPPYRQQ